MPNNRIVRPREGGVRGEDDASAVPHRGARIARLPRSIAEKTKEWLAVRLEAGRLPCQYAASRKTAPQSQPARGRPCM